MTETIIFVTPEEFDHFLKAQANQGQSDETRDARMEAVEHLHKARAECHARKIDIYFGDPAMEYLADDVHWSMEQSAVENGPIKSHTDGLAALQCLMAAYQSLIDEKAPPANFDDQVSMILAEIAGVAMRTAIDLGVCDDEVVDANCWDDGDGHIFIG